MSGPDDLMARMLNWSEDELDDHARISEHLSDDEMRNRAVLRTAESYLLADGWLIAHPDDPEMRAFLIEDGLFPHEGDQVLAKMRELGRERDRERPGWDRL